MRAESGKVAFTLIRISGTGGEMDKLCDYVKIAQAARILGVSQNTLRAWGEAGKIAMRRNSANGYRLFRREDLDAFLRDLAKPENRPRKAK